MSNLIDKALTAKRESKYLDFKESFDPDETSEWLELLKDIIAMANTGGGIIIIGLTNTGKPSGKDVSAVLELDHATIVDKVQKYTNIQFSEVEIHEAEKAGQGLAIIEISPVEIPLIFQNVGTYKAGPKKQKTAFSRGTIYFRHGAKSEPGSPDDLQKFIERRLESIRKEWLEGVRKVVKAEPGSAIRVFKGEVRESRSQEAVPIRFVDDPEAPGYRLIDHDTTFPYRQKELIDVVNGMLPDDVEINSYDILTIRRVHGIDEHRRFFHQPKYAGPQYSDEFAQWLVSQHKENKDFFKEAREKYYRKTH